MKQARVFLVGAAALTLWGCGGGGGSSSGTSGGDPLASGRAALNQMASGQQPTTTQSLQAALTLFKQATQQNPNSTQALFGVAVCQAGAIAQEIDGTGSASGGSGGSAGGVASGSSSGGSGKAAHSRDGEPLPPAPPGVTGSGGGTTTTPTLPAPPATGDLPPAPPGISTPVKPVAPTHTLGLFWFLDHGLSNPYTLLEMLGPVTDLRLGLAPYAGYAQDDASVTRREQMLTDLGTVSQDLAKVEADPNFTTTLPASDWNGQTVTVGLPEVYLFDAYVNSLRVELAMSLAYVRDPGTWQPVPQPVAVTTGGGNSGSGGITSALPPPPPLFTSPPASGSRDVTTPTSPFLALDTNHDGKLEPGEYLPPSPFLTLRSATYLTTAQQAMLTIVDREGKGISGVLARTSGGPYLIPNTTEVQTALKQIRDQVLPVIQQAASGPVTLQIPRYQPLALVANGVETVMQGDGNLVFEGHSQPIAGLPPAPPTFAPESVTIDIAAWFAKPPTDLKVFAPTYTLDANGYLDYSKTTYPDLTFGGLFPNGLPQDLQF